MRETTIILETAGENYDIIEKSGILECEGVTQNKALKKMSPMGISGIAPMAIPPIIIAIAILIKDISEGFKNITEGIKNIIELIKKLRENNKAFKLTVNGEELTSENYTDDEIEKKLTTALKKE